MRNYKRYIFCLKLIALYVCIFAINHWCCYYYLLNFIAFIVFSIQFNQTTVEVTVTPWMINYIPLFCMDETYTCIYYQAGSCGPFTQYSHELFDMPLTAPTIKWLLNERLYWCPFGAKCMTRDLLIDVLYATKVFVEDELNSGQNKKQYGDLQLEYDDKNSHY